VVPEDFFSRYTEYGDLVYKKDSLQEGNNSLSLKKGRFSLPIIQQSGGSTFFNSSFPPPNRKHSHSDRLGLISSETHSRKKTFNAERVGEWLSGEIGAVKGEGYDWLVEQGGGEKMLRGDLNIPWELRSTTLVICIHSAITGMFLYIPYMNIMIKFQRSGIVFLSGFM